MAGIRLFSKELYSLKSSSRHPSTCVFIMKTTRLLLYLHRARPSSLGAGDFLPRTHSLQGFPSALSVDCLEAHFHIASSSRREKQTLLELGVSYSPNTGAVGLWTGRCRAQRVLRDGYVCGMHTLSEYPPFPPPQRGLSVAWDSLPRDHHCSTWSSSVCSPVLDLYAHGVVYCTGACICL